MRELLILALLAAAGWFAYDDYYKQRPALKQAQEDVQRLTLERDQGRVGRAGAGRVYLQPASTPALPDWFQKRLDQGPALDGSRKHAAPSGQPDH